MTSAAWASVGVGALTLAFAITVSLLNRALAATRDQAVMRTQLDQVLRDLAAIRDDEREAHQLLTKQLVNDRRATDRRLRWLEEKRWTT